MIIVTGGAGFIGSVVVAVLNQHGRHDILIVDENNHPRKGRNLQPLKFEKRLGIAAFHQELQAGGFDHAGISGIVHLGACANTSEKDWDYLARNNVHYTKTIIQWSIDHGVRCVYASSAATYGDGRRGFDDAHELFKVLEPLNLYGKSKLEVDIWALNQGFLNQVAGIRYFNVFGPNEWHKGPMRSIVNHKYPDVRDAGEISLFKSRHPSYRDGDQERDFIYVEDAVAMTLWLLDRPETNGIFNVGTGCARTWNDVANSMFAAIGDPPKIHYMDMPNKLATQYQYHTQAEMVKLRGAGYDRKATSLEDAITDYIQNYLALDRHYGE
jgi:ADP-L-glycero-D-manno-heptose 6-epimerase